MIQSDDEAIYQAPGWRCEKSRVVCGRLLPISEGSLLSGQACAEDGGRAWGSVARSGMGGIEVPD